MSLFTPTSRMRIRRMTRLASVTLLAAVVLGTAGCSILTNLMPAQKPVRDAQSGEIVEERNNVDVFSIRVGDCISDENLDSDEIGVVKVMPCEGPHTDEIYYSFNLADGEFPGAEQVDELSHAGCYEQFDDFVGVAYESSEFEFWAMYPTIGSWSDGDREVLCLVYSPGGEITGSLQGVGR